MRNLFSGENYMIVESLFTIGLMIQPVNRKNIIDKIHKKKNELCAFYNKQNDYWVCLNCG